MIVFLDELSEFPDYYASSNGEIVNGKGEPYQHIRGEDGYYRVFCKNYQGEEKEILVHEEIAKNFVKFGHFFTPIFSVKKLTRKMINTT